MEGECCERLQWDVVVETTGEMFAQYLGTRIHVDREAWKGGETPLVAHDRQTVDGEERLQQQEQKRTYKRGVLAVD